MTTFADADLYVFRGEDETLWETLDVVWDEGHQSILRRHLLGTDALRSVPLGKSLAGWRRETLHLTAERYFASARPHGIAPALLAELPDFFNWNPLTIVTEAARDLLEELFPNGSLFFPLTIRDPETGEEVCTNRWAWTQVHRLRFDPGGLAGSQKMTVSCSGAPAKPGTVWEICNNRDFHRLSETLPFWGANPAYKGAIPA